MLPVPGDDPAFARLKPARRRWLGWHVTKANDIGRAQQDPGGARDFNEVRQQQLSIADGPLPGCFSWISGSRFGVCPR